MSPFAGVLIGLVGFLIAGVPPALLILLTGSPGLAGVLAWVSVFGGLGLGAILLRPYAIACATTFVLALALAAPFVPPEGLALFAGVLALGSAAGVIFSAHQRRVANRIGRWMVCWVVLPTAVAALAVGVDFAAIRSTGALWVGLAAALLWASDGRWLGAWAGLSCVGAPAGSVWRISAAMVNSGAGVIQVAMISIWSLTDSASDALILSALVGAAMIELTSGLRVFIARQFDPLSEQ